MRRESRFVGRHSVTWLATCQVCGDKFSATLSTARFCSKRCMERHRTGRLNPRSYIDHAAERERGVQTCSKCRELKPLDAFRIVPRNGLPSSWCRPCHQAANHEWRRRRANAEWPARRRTFANHPQEDPEP